jgi:predicted phosphodiesterase
VRGLLAIGVVLAACAEGEPPTIGVAPAAAARVPEPNNHVAAPPKPALPSRWTIAVLSDLHLPNPKHVIAEQVVADLIARRVRAVVITGDSTNGTGTGGVSDAWWRAVTTTLAPLREAGIAVLPVAGNHDSYGNSQRAAYLKAFGDAASWAKPLTINRAGAGELAKPPFSYSVDLDGVHLVMVHIVDNRVAPDVLSWLASDLEAAAGAKHRIAFGHVPLVSVIREPSRALMSGLGARLERGGVELYVAGHEHLVWDETFTLPAGGTLRQLTVGCSSGFYDYAPSIPAKTRAGCVPIQSAGKREPMRCTMPNGGAFEIARGRKDRHIQHYTNSFTLIHVDGDRLTVEPMTIDATGHAQPFYL